MNSRASLSTPDRGICPINQPDIQLLLEHMTEQQLLDTEEI
jgi:hypothetical protein